MVPITITTTTTMRRRRRQRQQHERRRKKSFFSKILYLLFLLVVILAMFSLQDYNIIKYYPMTILSIATSSSSTSSSSSETTRRQKHDLDGQSNLMEGRRYFQLGHYDEASAYFWKAVLLHNNENDYTVDEAFAPFLQCYLLQHKLVDGFVFIAAESYGRNQLQMANLYLEQALERDDKHEGALRLKQFMSMHDDDGSIGHDHYSNNAWSKKKAALLREIRDNADASIPKTKKNQEKKKSIHHHHHHDDDENNNDNDIFHNNAKPILNLQQFDPSLLLHSTTPEEIYNIGTHYFNAKQLLQASQLFELSCQKSNYQLYVACTNAVYLRSNLCEWGYLGEGFERDMKIVEKVTEMEMEMYREIIITTYNNNNIHDDNIHQEEKKKKMRRDNGIGNPKNNLEGIFHWKRSTSVHPHMMLGYPLDNSRVILKRYVSESMASLDELRARVREDGSGDGGGIGIIDERPMDLPYSVGEMRDKFLQLHHRHSQQQQQQQQQQNQNQNQQQNQQQNHSTNNTSTGEIIITSPIKVGFVSCGFNSKAVLYLSHDMFRFFDPSHVEIHIFSTGPPDHPQFIQNTMRGVDWRQRVIDTVDHFHDVRHFQQDHIGLARFIHDMDIQILIEWDGYARQGERAAGLMALRPCPIQILHQEFLGTSGAQYIDYIVTDKVASPMRLEHLYTEKFLYLPHHFFSKGHAVQREVVPPMLEYVPKKKTEMDSGGGGGAEFQLGVGSPQENACLSSNPLGRGASHRDQEEKEEVAFVYCNFNKFLKHNPETMRSWLRILEEVPNSILCLLENPKEGIPNLRKFVNEVAASSSINSDGNDDEYDNPDNDKISNLNNRIHFLSWEKNPFDHQQRSHSLCNAMLDSHPYNGHTTAQDALYAGVPIVTRSDGDDMSSRVSTSANIILGMDELNAHTGIKQYEDIAIRLGNDKSWFNSIRTKLVETCLQKNPMHPYWDVPRYVKNFEKGLLMVWERFLRGEQIDHVEVLDPALHGMEIDSGGTMEAELVSREKKRKDMKKKQILEAEGHGMVCS